MMPSEIITKTIKIMITPNPSGFGFDDRFEKAPY
jgi:hypothetical protein